MPKTRSSRVDALPLARSRDFETTLSGKDVRLFTLRSPSLVTQITNYGGRVVNLYVPDRRGNLGNIVLGFDSLEQYLSAKERFYGAIVGRYANRIGGARITVDGVEHELAANEGRNHLHGGFNGFDRVVWDVQQLDDMTLTLTYSSRRREEGYPGAVVVLATYRLTPDLGLMIEYEARSDAPTVVNLTHHSYFNLAGPGSGPVSNHALQIPADRFTPVDEELIATGEIASVEDTPLDFRTPRQIGEREDEDFEQIRFGKGYDHNWVLGPTSGPTRTAARVYEHSSGRTMEVLTTEPGLQFYGGNLFDGTDVGASGQAHRFREAFALETQHFPDSPNKPHFPSTILRPGDVYRSRTTYRFLTG